MDLNELNRILHAPGSIWVRRASECSSCDDAPVWVLVRFENGELSSDWYCEACADPSWAGEGFNIVQDPTLLLALPAAGLEACASRPSGPLCGARAEYLAIYPVGTPDGKIRAAGSCVSCVGDVELSVGSALALPQGLG